MADTTPVTVQLVPDDKLIELFPTLDASARSALNISITQMIEEYCNTKFDSRSYEGEYYDDKADILLDNMPILSITSVQRKNGEDLTDLVADEDYYVYPDRLVMDSPTGYRRYLKIAYVAGMPSVPPLAYQVALDLARYKAFKDTEGIMLFYKAQTFEERQYQTNPDVSEVKILSRLSRYVQSSRKKSAGKGAIRVGVM